TYIIEVPLDYDYGHNYYSQAPTAIPKPTATSSPSSTATPTSSPTATTSPTATATPTPVPTATASPYVYLDLSLGGKAGDDPNCVEFTAGTRINLDKITGGTVSAPETNCDFY